jgi:hypothetical protein
MGDLALERGNAESETTKNCRSVESFWREKKIS